MPEINNILHFTNATEDEIDQIARQFMEMHPGLSNIIHDNSIVITNKPRNLWYCETKHA